MNSYATIDLRDIDLSALRLVKETYQWFGDQDHSRWVFQSRASSDYFKIWNPTYIRRDHLLRGLDLGFYDATTVPALQGLITADGICRGYAMHKCTPVRERNLDFHFVVLERTAHTCLFSVQYSRYHAMQYGDRFSLIDLEAVHPLSELRNLASRYQCVFDDPEYERFVIDLYGRMYPHWPAVEPSTREKRKPSAMDKIRSRARTLTQKLTTRWRAIFNHIEMIEQ